MVICMVKDCGKHSDRNSDKDVSFHRLPAVSNHRGEKDYKLQNRWRDGGTSGNIANRFLIVRKGESSQVDGFAVP